MNLPFFSCIIEKVQKTGPLGGVAQLGERYTGSVEVMGSNPTVSTAKRCKIRDFTTFFFFRNNDMTGLQLLPANLILPCFPDLRGIACAWTVVHLTVDPDCGSAEHPVLVHLNLTVFWGKVFQGMRCRTVTR